MTETWRLLMRSKAAIDDVERSACTIIGYVDGAYTTDRVNIARYYARIVADLAASRACFEMAVKLKEQGDG